VVRTNIRARGNRKFRQFSWIEGYTDITDEGSGQSRGMTLTLPEWLHEGILIDGGVLAVSPAYFTISGGRERWLYRVAHKHAGGHGWPGFAISLPTLFEKSGAEGTYRRFKHELKRIADANELPEFALAWEERAGEEPILRMVRRSALDPGDQAYKPSGPPRRRAAAR
jgi:plasmid replication initiation protein